MLLVLGKKFKGSMQYLLPHVLRSCPTQVNRNYIAIKINRTLHGDEQHQAFVGGRRTAVCLVYTALQFVK